MKKATFRKPKEKPDESYQGTFSGDDEFDVLVEQVIYGVLVSHGLNFILDPIPEITEPN